MPKRKEEVEDVDVDEEEETPKPKRARKPAAKKTKEPKEDVDGDDEEASAKPKRVRKPAAKKVTEPKKLDNGWVIHPPSLIYKIYKEKDGDFKKIAAFDLDDTLVYVKSGRQFPTNADDWKLFNKNVASVLQQHHDDGFRIVIFSNQGGIKGALEGVQAVKTMQRIDNVVKELKGMPAAVFMATQQDEMRKPNDGMWRFMTEHCNGGVQPDLSQCFFVGDASGRSGDFASSDKEFAEKIGIDFKTPEDMFGESERKKDTSKMTKVTTGVNKDLIDAMQSLVDAVKQSIASDDKAVFRARAYEKVVDALGTVPDKIKTASQLKGIKGIGKASMAKIDEFLTTGKIQEVEDILGPDAAKQVEKAKDDAAKSQKSAMAFLD